MTFMTTSVYSLSSKDWASLLKAHGHSASMLNFWTDGLYKNRDIWQRHIAPKWLEQGQELFDFDLPQIAQILKAQDGTVKFQIQFKDGLSVETVLIPFHKRFTVCLSTQVGCAMNCSFCYTATQGLKRHLTAGEIVGQYLVAYEYLRKQHQKTLKPSIVFMGQGEPLHNFEQVMKAIEVLNDPNLIGVGHRQMTLSTVGFLPALQKVPHTFLPINFALSLHSPFEHERNELIPLNLRYPLAEVTNALDQIPLLPRQFITYEYLLIKDFNMSDAHVRELQKLLGHRRAILNLIPFNPFPGSKWQRPSLEEINTFKEKLVSQKLRVMVRTTKGDDILAACGQLKINKLARNYVHS